MINNCVFEVISESKTCATLPGFVMGFKQVCDLEIISGEKQVFQACLKQMQQNGFVNFYHTPDEELLRYSFIGKSIFNKRWDDAVESIFQLDDKWEKDANLKKDLLQLKENKHSILSKALALEGISPVMMHTFLKSFSQQHWNDVVSKRLAFFGLKALKGDLTLSFSNTVQLINDEAVPITDISNIVMPVLGSEMIFPNNTEIRNLIMQEIGKHTNNVGARMNETLATADYRPIVCKPIDFRWYWTEVGVSIEFKLPVSSSSENILRALGTCLRRPEDKNKENFFKPTQNREIKPITRKQKKMLPDEEFARLKAERKARAKDRKLLLRQTELLKQSKQIMRNKPPKSPKKKKSLEALITDSSHLENGTTLISKNKKKKLKRMQEKISIEQETSERIPEISSSDRNHQAQENTAESQMSPSHSEMQDAVDPRNPSYHSNIPMFQDEESNPTPSTSFTFEYLQPTPPVQATVTADPPQVIVKTEKEEVIIIESDEESKRQRTPNDNSNQLPTKLISKRLELELEKTILRLFEKTAESFQIPASTEGSPTIKSHSKKTSKKSGASKSSKCSGILPPEKNPTEGAEEERTEFLGFDDVQILRRSPRIIVKGGRPKKRPKRSEAAAEAAAEDNADDNVFPLLKISKMEPTDTLN